MKHRLFLAGKMAVRAPIPAAKPITTILYFGVGTGKYRVLYWERLHLLEVFLATH
jgi:hypothetical protein